MAGKPSVGDGLPADLAGMTKNQLYDIMSQMKTLIEQNKQQAKDILIQNPALTKALFQAQIMLGMVQTPRVIPNIQPTASQQPPQSAQTSQQANTQAAHSLPVQGSLQEQTGASQVQPPMRKQHHIQPIMPLSSASAHQINLPSQPIPLHPLQPPQQPKGHPNPQGNPISIPQSSQLPNIPPSLLSSQPPPLHQPQMPVTSMQLQPPLQTTGIPHMPLQPPLSTQARPPSMPSFHNQHGPHMGPNMGFQHTGAPQIPSQSMFHAGNKPQASMGPSFPQGQPHLLSQPLPPSLYQAGGSHIGAEFNNRIGSSVPVDRGSSWMPGLPDNSALTQLPGQPSLVPGQMAPVNHSSRPASLTPEMEKALLQQVMSLTPEQINLLPPEQRNQVLQLQQMLRQ